MVEILILPVESASKISISTNPKIYRAEYSIEYAKRSRSRTLRNMYQSQCIRNLTGKSVYGWLRLVGSFKLYISLAEYPLFYRALLQKRPMILRSLLVAATPYRRAEYSIRCLKVCCSVSVSCNVENCRACLTVCCSVLQFVKSARHCNTLSDSHQCLAMLKTAELSTELGVCIASYMGWLRLVGSLKW